MLLTQLIPAYCLEVPRSLFTVHKKKIYFAISFPADLTQQYSKSNHPSLHKKRLKFSTRPAISTRSALNLCVRRTWTRRARYLWDLRSTRRCHCSCSPILAFFPISLFLSKLTQKRRRLCFRSTNSGDRSTSRTVTTASRANSRVYLSSCACRSGNHIGALIYDLDKWCVNGKVIFFSATGEKRDGDSGDGGSFARGAGWDWDPGGGGYISASVDSGLVGCACVVAVLVLAHFIHRLFSVRDLHLSTDLGQHPTAVSPALITHCGLHVPAVAVALAEHALVYPCGHTKPGL
jgi:hypothetical protein